MFMTTHMLVEVDQVVAPSRPAQVIYVGEEYVGGFDARPGDTVIVIMAPKGDVVARCDDMGGESIWNPYTSIATCEKVDF